MTDVFTKYSWAVPTKDQTAITTAKVLVREWFVRFGVPLRLHSDQGRNVEGKVEELAFVRGVLPLTTLKETLNVRASIGHYMICYVC